MKDLNKRKKLKGFDLGNVTDYGMTKLQHKHYRNKLRTETKEIPVFPVEISYKEPNPDLKIEKPIKRKRKSTRALGTNPRAKGTNPRAKKND